MPLATPSDTIRIIDRRPSAGEFTNVTSDYPAKDVGDLIRKSLKYGVDPRTVLAVSLRENTLGTRANLAHGAWDDPGKVQTQGVLDRLIEKRNRLVRQSEIAGETGDAWRAYNDPAQKRLLADIDNTQKEFNEAFGGSASVFARTVKDKMDVGRKRLGAAAPEDQLIRHFNWNDKLYGKKIMDLKTNAVGGNPKIDQLIDYYKKNPWTWDDIERYK